MVLSMWEARSADHSVPTQERTMRTKTFYVQLSKPDGECIKAIIEQPNELMAVLAASKTYHEFTVDSVASYLLYS